MTDIEQTIKDRIVELDNEFEDLKTKVIDAEKFVSNGKTRMAVIQGIYKENSDILKTFMDDPEEEVSNE